MNPFFGRQTPPLQLFCGALTLAWILIAGSACAQEMKEPHKPPVKAHPAKKSNPVQKGGVVKSTPGHAAVSTLPSESVEPLSPELLEIASQIYTGRMQCELGQVVLLLPIQEMPGRFQLTLKKQKYLMTPSVTPTGAIKLEDPQLGAFWIQLGNKSMLFNSKLGQRMADECQGPGQQAVAMRERISPPPSLLEPLPRVDH
jgi:hypothetical protein